MQKSASDIARLLDYDIADVTAFINSAVEGSEIVTCQMKLDARKKARPSKAAPGKRRKPEQVRRAEEKNREYLISEQKRLNKLEKENIEQSRRKASWESRRPLYKTKVVDYSKLITVRINRKTVIYAKPGEDIEKLKKSFRKNYPKLSIDDNEF